MGNVPEGFVVVDVNSDADLDHTVDHIAQTAASVESGDGVILLADLFGATPCNAAVRACTEKLGSPSVLVAGANLPMVLRALGFRDIPINQAAERLVMGGRNGIVSTGATAPQRQTFNPAEKDDSGRNQHQQ